MDIAGLPGKLVIVGGGTTPDAARQRFVTLAGGKEKAKIVVVPTASADADDPAKLDAFAAEWTALTVRPVTLLHARNKTTLNDTTFWAPLDAATAVWFSGGDPSRIIVTVRGTLVEKKLHALFARGGAIGGLSINVAAELGYLPGFAAEAGPGIVGIGVPENNAMACSGRRVEAIGESTATVTLLPGGGKGKVESVVRARQPSDLVQLRRAAANRASAGPFPPKSAPAPVVEKGSLVIVGGGGATKDIMDTFFEKAGGKDKLVVVIPTASETDAVPVDPGDAQFLRRWGGTNVKVLHTRNRREADDPRFSDVLTKAAGVWFGGGRQWRFVDSYEGTLTANRFREVLDRGGVIGGSSAGASIQSEYMPRGHPLGNTIMAAEGYERGFGYLPGVAVDQHFIARKRFNDLNSLIKQYPQYLGLGIDEATAVVVAGSTAKVLGRSKVNVLDASKDPKNPAVTELTAGDVFDLKERKKIEP
jgi:cyanophycinase